MSNIATKYTHQTFRNADNSRFYTNVWTHFSWMTVQAYTTPQRIIEKTTTTTLAVSHSSGFVEKIFTCYRFVSCTVIVKEWTLSLAVKPRTNLLLELHQHCVDNLLMHKREIARKILKKEKSSKTESNFILWHEHKWIWPEFQKCLSLWNF